MKQNWTAFIKSVTIIAVIMLISCGREEQSKHFSATDFGDAWPLQGVTEGDVKCLEGMYVVFETENDTYAVNAAAAASAMGEERGWKKLSDIHIKYKDISPFIEAGMSICQSAN